MEFDAEHWANELGRVIRRDDSLARLRTSFAHNETSATDLQRLFECLVRRLDSDLFASDSACEVMKIARAVSARWIDPLQLERADGHAFSLLRLANRAGVPVDRDAVASLLERVAGSEKHLDAVLWDEALVALALLGDARSGPNIERALQRIPKREDPPHHLSRMSFEEAARALALFRGARAFDAKELPQDPEQGSIERILLTAHVAAAEVSNGGLWQFFFNGGNETLAIEALDHIRAHEQAELLQLACGVFGPRRPPRSTAARRAQMERWDDAQLRRLEEISNLWFRAPTSVQAALNLYLAHNVERLPASMRLDRTKQ